MHYKKTMILFSIITPLCIALRIGQLFWVIRDNGLTWRRYSGPSFRISVVLCAAGVALAVLGMLGLRCPTRMPKPCWHLRTVSLLMAAWTAFDALSGFGISIPHWQVQVLQLFAVIACVYFIAAFFEGIIPFKMPPLATVAPLTYWLVRTLFFFIRLNNLVMTSGLIFMLAAHCTLLLFWLCYAKIANKIDTEYNFKKVLGFGLAAVFFCLIYSIPNFVKAAVYGNIALLTEGFHENITILLSALFALVFMLRYYRNGNLRHHHHHHHVKFQPGVTPENFYTGMPHHSHSHHHSESAATTDSSSSSDSKKAD